MSWLKMRAAEAAREALVASGIEMPLYRERLENAVTDAIERAALEFAARALRTLTNWEDVQGGKALQALNEGIVHALEQADKEET